MIPSLLVLSVNAEEIVKENEKSTNELLSEISQKIEITNYILIFFLMIHFSEKWFAYCYQSQPLYAVALLV